MINNAISGYHNNYIKPHAIGWPPAFIGRVLALLERKLIVKNYN